MGVVVDPALRSVAFSESGSCSVHPRGIVWSILPRKNLSRLSISLRLTDPMRHYLVLSALVVVGPLAFFVVRMRKNVSATTSPSWAPEELALAMLDAFLVGRAPSSSRRARYVLG